MKYSVVIPAYNEEGNVAELHREIVATMRALGEPYEIIFINDGSNDGTLTELKKLSPATVINFRRNYGQTAALDAGLHHARGEVVITMDADLQNDPADIPKLLEQLGKFDAVCGWRWPRRDSFSKKLISAGAAYFRRFFISDGVHDSGCTLRVYKSECFGGNTFGLYGEMHRFIPGILRWQGFKIGEAKVHHRARKSGQTKYNWRRTLKGLVDMINLWFWRKYSARPVHIFGGMGFILSVAGTGLLGVLLMLRLFKIVALADSIWPLVAVLMILVGIQLFVSGIIADLVTRHYYQDTRKPYLIKEVIVLE